MIYPSELRSAASLRARPLFSHYLRDARPARGAPCSGGCRRLQRRPTSEYVPESIRRCPVIQVPPRSSRGPHQEHHVFWWWWWWDWMEGRHVREPRLREVREESCVLREVLGDPCCSEETSSESGGAPSLLLQGQ